MDKTQVATQADKNVVVEPEPKLDKTQPGVWNLGNTQAQGLKTNLGKREKREK